MATGTLEGVRVASNDDLHDMGVDSDKTSNTSDELSENSETYDFLNVYMPSIRPKEIDENEAEELAKKAAEDAKKGSKAKKGLKKQSASFAMKSGPGAL